MNQLGQSLPCVLTIAGSDSGGGAGIQADLKTFAALGAYGASAITAITAQNTQGVQAVQVIPPAMIRQQCEAVLSDIRIDAIKIGMLPDVASILVVADIVRRFSVPFVVLDPVLVATSGDSLALEDTVEALLHELMPLANIITPNLNELAQLRGKPVAEDQASMVQQGAQLLVQGAAAVLLKGGHGQHIPTAQDWLITPYSEPQCFNGHYVATANTHGTGCTLSSAIAALFPQQPDLSATIAAAKRYVQGAIEAGQHWQIGQGHGPLNHFWQHCFNT